MSVLEISFESKIRNIVDIIIGILLKRNIERWCIAVKLCKKCLM